MLHTFLVILYSADNQQFAPLHLCAFAPLREIKSNRSITMNEEPVKINFRSMSANFYMHLIKGCSHTIRIGAIMEGGSR